MKNKLTIKGAMTDMNQYINANRNNKYSGAAIKKEETERVAWEVKAQGIGHYEGLVGLTYILHRPDMRKDEDNLMIYCKWINDGLATAGVIVNDSPRHVKIKSFEVVYDGNNYTEVIIEDSLPA